MVEPPLGRRARRQAPVALMVAGIALLGVVSTSIASWFVEKLRRTAQEVGPDVEQEIEQDSARTEAQLDAVPAELRAISARLDVLERDRSS